MGLKRKRYIGGGGDNFVDLPSERASDAADRNATWVWGDGRGRKGGRGKMQRKKWNFYKTKFLLQEGRKENIKKKKERKNMNAFRP